MELELRLEGPQGEIPCDSHFVAWAYQRRKGNKVINQIPALNGFRTENPDMHLTKYDLFCAVDTNTSAIQGVNVSVSCVMVGRSKPVESVSETSFDFFFKPVAFYEFRHQQETPETYGWWLVIKALLEDPLANPDEKIAIIVDSRLDELEAINKRQKPFYQKYLLPPNYKLLYASSDVGKEFVINKIFSQCDKEAKAFSTRMIGVYDQHGFPGGDKGMPFLRIWLTPQAVGQSGTLKTNQREVGLRGD